jgi:formate dehydrogenase subunit gamma
MGGNETLMAHAIPWNAGRAAEIVAAHAATAGAMLPILHDLQHEFGCVPEEATPLIAQALNLTRAEVHGVITFYHDFRRTPPGRHVLRLCRAEACQAMGGAALAARLLARLGVEWGETTADGAWTVEPVYCLGLCACAPAALLDGAPLGRLDQDALHRTMTEMAGS